MDENSVNQENYSASLGKPRDLVTEFSIRTSQSLKILLIKIHTKKCNVRTFVTHEYEIFCPYLCYI